MGKFHWDKTSRGIHTGRIKEGTAGKVKRWRRKTKRREKWRGREIRVALWENSHGAVRRDRRTAIQMESSQENDYKGQPSSNTWLPGTIANEGVRMGSTQTMWKWLQRQIDSPRVIIERQFNTNNKIKGSIYNDIMASIGLDNPTPSHETKTRKNNNIDSIVQLIITPICNCATSLVALRKPTFTPKTMKD